jgi:hypothetical protein
MAFIDISVWNLDDDHHQRNGKQMRLPRRSNGVTDKELGSINIFF